MKRVFTSALLLAAFAAGAQTTDPTPYCSGAFNLNGAYINSVSVGAFTNNTTGASYSRGYLYYDNLTGPTLAAGGSYTATVNFSFPSIHFVAVFIDHNQNNSFADAGELVLLKMINTTTGNPTSPATQSFTVPATATPGTTRMRVIVFEDDDYTFGGTPPTQPPATVPYSCVPASATGNWQQGQTQDYNVTISGSAQAVPTSTTQAATMITANGATLNGSVNANGAITTISFEYGPTTAYGQNKMATPPTVSGNTMTAVSAVLSGLLPNTTYHYRVWAVNSGGTGSSNDMTFTTSPLGVANVNGENAFRIAPNPSNGVFRLTFPNGSMAKPISATFYNSLGQQALQTKSDANGNIDAAVLPAGMYQLLLSDEKGNSATHRVLLQR